MSAIAIIKAGENFYILLYENLIAGFESREVGIEYFEKMYNERHARSYESSMSAMLNWMTYQPSVIECPPLEVIKNSLADENIHRLISVSGGLNGGLLKQAIGQEWWDNGAKPRLIH